MLLLHPHGHDYGIDIDENITKNIPSFIATKITREIFRNRNKTIGEVIDKVCDDINNIFSVILIDSPEIALHPQWQRKIIDVYEGIGENNQFIIATNSQYIIDNIESKQLRILNKNAEGIKLVEKVMGLKYEG